MKRRLKKIVFLFDLMLWPWLLVAIGVMRLFRRLPLRKMRCCRWLLERLGVFPIVDSYLEPAYKRSDIRLDPKADRVLPGIDWNESEQLQWLDKFSYQTELEALPREKKASPGSLEFYYHNCSFEAGDAEYLYSMIRFLQPARLIEVGCGYSTLLAQTAIRQNQTVNPGYHCRHCCIEPYVNYWNSWLEQLPVELVREKVERLDWDLFKSLQRGDILFIDSSHVIRPQGDVLYEYLEILPILAPGVMVHIHDIFSPKDFQALWYNDVSFSNEQYLLEAFLTQNREYKIIGAVNYLAHHHRVRLADKFPVFSEDQLFCQPGSFWIQKQ